MHLRISLILLAILLSFPVFAQDSITFVIKNAGINVDGTFGRHSITQNFDLDQIEKVKFSARISVSSLDTGIKARDNHLKKEKYFHLDSYPYITFRSTDVSRSADGYVMKGELQIKATQRSVEIPFQLVEIDGVERFKGYLEIDRRDYDVGKNHLIMGDLVKIYLSVVNRNSL